MNSSIRIVSALLLISSIISCKKNKDEATDSDSARLSKMTQWNVATPSTDIITKQFIYDAQKRVVEMITFTGDSVGGEIKNRYSDTLKCFYNANETNPYKTIGFGLFYITTDGLEAFHSYSSSGELLEDSIPAPSRGLTRIRKYNYLTDKILVKIQEKSGSAVTTFQDSLLLADHNFNEIYLNPFSSTQSYVAGYKIKYDTKINPISKLNIASLFTTNVRSMFAAIMAPAYCKNNMTEFTFGNSTKPGDFTKQGTVYFNYTYSDDGLPTECRLNVVIDINSTSNNYIIKYEYID